MLSFKARRYAIVLAIFFCSQTVATEVYVTRDAQGNVVFSDQPQKGAETHQVKPIPTVPGFIIPKTEPETIKPPKTFRYTSLTIVTPPDQHQVPTGQSGHLQVSGVLSPGLEAGHVIQLLDNDQILKSAQETNFSLEYLNRGEHKLQMRVVDAQKKILMTSNTVTVHIERHSLLNRSQKNHRSN